MRELFVEETFPILMAFFGGECFSILVGKIEFLGAIWCNMRPWYLVKYVYFWPKKTEFLNIDTHVLKTKSFTKPIILGIHLWNLRVLLS